ncbi:MAG: HepT-like ribonuclease domain-containing protein [Candidatus Binataceae bacterium]
MSRHEGLVRFRHMLDHAREAVSMVSGKTRRVLDTDRKLNLALVRLLEIVGEAAGRTSADERSKYSAIPWSQIVGLRNRLIHGYDPSTSIFSGRLLVTTCRL